MSARRLWVLLVAAIVLAGAVAAAIWRDDILEALLDPKIPYAVYRPPAAPDYAKPTSWALPPGYKTDSSAALDVFFVHPTTFDGGREWNGPITDQRASNDLRRVMLPNYAGPYAAIGAVYAPLYRQASLYTSLSLFDDAIEAREFAYRDVLAAFRRFRASAGERRPFVLAGVEQGGVLAARLLKEEIAPSPALRRRLMAAYLIETAVPDEGLPPACETATQTGCLLAWVSINRMDFVRADRIRQRARVWDDDGHLVPLAGRPILCVNPELGRKTTEAADARLNVGAANATGLEWGVRPGFMARQVAATCVNGILQVSRPRSQSLRSSGSWADRLKAPPYNLFWGDLEADVGRRFAAWRGAQPASPGPAS